LSRAENSAPSQRPSPWSLAADLLDPALRLGPAAFVSEKLGETLWSKQREVAQSVVENRRTAVKSCHAAGKSFTASRLTAWWLWSHVPGTAFVVTTAPTFEQVRAVLWREIGRAHRKGNLLGRVNQTEWWIGDEMVAFGRKPGDADPTAFQGIHAEYVLVILDEACGIERDLWMAAMSLAANDKSRILAIGNPDDPGSHFAEICRPGSGWNVLQIGYQDSPNFTSEAVPSSLRPLLIGPTYVEEMRSDVGEDSAPWMAKVLGEFPEDADDGVVSLSALRRCMRPDQEHTAEDLLPIELGWDVGAGGDKSVVRERTGVVAGRAWYLKGPDTMAQCGEVLRITEETGATAIKIDSIGIGHGAADRMAELRASGEHRAKVVRVNVGEASTRPHRFPKLRDQVWWEVGRMLCQDGAWDLSGIDDATVAQLTAPKYQLDSSGRIKVEAKADTRARLGRSPDDADALLLAFFTGNGQGTAFLDTWKRELEADRLLAETKPDVPELRHVPRLAAYEPPPLSKTCQHRFFQGQCAKCGGQDPKEA
jgi:hypothetical protein